MNRRAFLAGVAGVTAGTTGGCLEAPCGDDYAHDWNVNATHPSVSLASTDGWDDGIVDVSFRFLNRTRCSISSITFRAAIRHPSEGELASGASSVGDVPSDEVVESTVELDVGDSLDEDAGKYSWSDVVETDVDVTF